MYNIYNGKFPWLPKAETLQSAKWHCSWSALCVGFFVFVLSYVVVSLNLWSWQFKLVFFFFFFQARKRGA